VQEPISLETPVGSDEDVSLGELIEDKSVAGFGQELINADLRDAINEAFMHLTPREEKVLKMRFGLVTPVASTRLTRSAVTSA